MQRGDGNEMIKESIAEVQVSSKVRGLLGQEWDPIDRRHYS